MVTIYEGTGSQNSQGLHCAYFSKTGNGIFGNIIRTGWKKTKLGKVKQQRIIIALDHVHTDKVYRRGNRIYKSLLNGLEIEI